MLASVQLDVFVSDDFQGIVQFDDNGDLQDRTVSVFQIKEAQSARPDDVSRQYHYIGVAPQV